jgi:cell division transport system permease protein
MLPRVAITREKFMRRKWITITRICRYGLANFARNAWLTTAATVVMTVTLTIILATFTLHLVFNDTLADIRQKIDISVYLADTITDQQKTELTNALKSVSSVTTIDYVSKAQARQDYVNQNSGDKQQLEALSVLGDTNPFPASLKVHVSNTDHLSDISKLVAEKKYQSYQSKPASLNGSRKDAIENIARAAQFSEIAGWAVSGLFLVLSIMVIFNTIRMAIFNRRDEIEIMKLIGAEKSFIRGPFIVEACLYGIFAAIVAITIMYLVLLSAGPALTNYGVNIAPTIRFFGQYPALIFLGEVLAGILIGIVSSFLAIRRYLKV